MSEGMKRRKSVRNKIALVICSVALIIAVVCIGSGCFLGIDLLQKTITGSYHNMADLLARSIAAALESEVKEIETLSRGPIWLKTIRENDLKYANMRKEDIARLFMDKAKDRTDATENDPMVKEIIGSELAATLKNTVETSNSIREIHVTDRFGDLIAASKITKDFYCADKNWWQAAFNDGKGGIFVGDLFPDASNDNLNMVIAISIKDEAGRVCGLCKAVVDADYFFTVAKNFRLGKTGHIIIKDRNKDTVVFCNEGATKVKFIKSDYRCTQEGHVFLASAAVSNPTLTGKEAFWRIYICQNISEAFAPLRKLIFELVLLMGVLLMLLVPIGFGLAYVFMAPMKKIHEGVRHIRSGDLDYRVEVKTGDEMEELGDFFNRMAEDLKRTTVSINVLNMQIEARKAAEEKTRAVLEQLEEAQAELIQASKMAAVGQLATGAAHEINNPMSVISGEAEMLLMDKNKDDQTKSASKAIMEQVRRVEDVIGRLLAFSRKTELVIEYLDINKVVEESMRFVSYQVKFENITIVKDLASGLPKVAGNENQLGEVFINIILNAIQSIKDNGAIKIRTDRVKILENKIKRYA